jgi:hypothetical protein
MAWEYRVIIARLGSREQELVVIADRSPPVMGPDASHRRAQRRLQAPVLERLAGYSCHKYACELTASLPSAEMLHSGNRHDHFGNVMLPQFRIRPLRRDLLFRCQRPGLR